MMQARTPGLMLLIAALLAWLLGCVADTPPPQPELPTLSELRPHYGSTATQPSADTQPVARVPVIAHIRRIEFPFFQSDLSSARDLLTRKGIPLDQIDMWRANGLFAGIVEPSDQRRFLQALPPYLGGDQSRLVSLSQTTFLSITPQLTRRAKVTVTLPDGREHPLQMSAGRCQFILRFHRTTDQRLLVECIPHHHLPKPSLIPRLPQEKELDGRIYEELTLSAPLQNGQWLVLGIEFNARPEPPPVEPAATQPEVSTSQASPTADTQPTAMSELPSPFVATASADATMTDRNIPDTLGVMLLGLLRHNKPIQTLVIISLEDK